jgi:hypothetical protein
MSTSGMAMVAARGDGRGGTEWGNTLGRHHMKAPVIGVKHLDGCNSNTQVTVTPWTVHTE